MVHSGSCKSLSQLEGKENSRQKPGEDIGPLSLFIEFFDTGPYVAQNA